MSCVVTDEVAVIDEIQMIRDTQRGWAWTRAFLGLLWRFLHCSENKLISYNENRNIAVSKKMYITIYVIYLIIFITSWIKITASNRSNNGHMVCSILFSKISEI